MGWLEDADLSLDEEKDIKKKENKKPAKKPQAGNLNSTIKKDDSNKLGSPSDSGRLLTHSDFIYEYTQELIAAGFEMGGEMAQVTDSSPKRMDVDGAKRGSLSGWYYFKLMPTAAFGTYGDWRTGGATSWKSYSNSSPTAEEISTVKKQIEDQKKKAEKERETLRSAAESFVRSKVQSFKKVDPKHAYVKRKKIAQACTMTFCYSWRTQNSELLVIPIYNNKGEVVNWQTIDEDGNKRFKKHAVKKGNFHAFGDPSNSNFVIYCEGFATGASIYMALGGCVIVCFDAYNLLPVMENTQAMTDCKDVFIGCDHDGYNQQGNRTGEYEAEKCVERFPYAKMVVPKYVSQDFNDIHKKEKLSQEGLAKVSDYFFDKGLTLPERDYKIWDGIDSVAPFPSELKKIPSLKCQELADWMLTTAHKASNQTAIIGALSFACGVAGRRYKEVEHGNYSSIMSCFIAPSGGGKDFVKTCINKILSKSPKLESLIGSSSYTSEAAIRSQLISSPVKISVLDEFGDKLTSAFGNGGGREAEAFNAFKEIYSDCRGVWAGRAYAMTGNTDQQAKTDLRSESVKNPSLTILGLSTPKQFVDAISESHVEGGFLNRLIVIDARNDVVTRQRYINHKVPDWIVPHCERVASSSNPLHGNLRTFEADYSQPAKPLEFPLSKEVSDIIWDFSNYIDRQYSDSTFLLNLSSRWVENAIRVCVGLAAFENPESPNITLDMMKWALSLTQYHGVKLGELMERYSYVSMHHKSKSEILEAIRSKVGDGMTKTQMNRSRAFIGLDIKTRNKMLNELESDGLIKTVSSGRASKKVSRYYALKPVG